MWITTDEQKKAKRKHIFIIEWEERMKINEWLNDKVIKKYMSKKMFTNIFVQALYHILQAFKTINRSF